MSRFVNRKNLGLLMELVQTFYVNSYKKWPAQTGCYNPKEVKF